MTGSERPAKEAGFHVGDRVSTVVIGESGTDKFEGTIVEDFGSSTDAPGLGRTWAAQRQWGVALDDGRLVFRNTDEITNV
ncbi:hypothetical protein [Aldersonia kunmingensis]|uniref:hypothetical protein n=1 Tax=Aldersonia kunmingensis TaxID=408066 RepID=UPI00083549C6|nr:hypothetical protein [Aldersonia kunmingensis]